MGVNALGLVANNNSVRKRCSPHLTLRERAVELQLGLGTIM